MTPQRVALITLGVKDLTRSKEFYENIGWRAHLRSQETIILFQMNGLALGLFELEALADDLGRPRAKLGTGAMALAIAMKRSRKLIGHMPWRLRLGRRFLKSQKMFFWMAILAITQMLMITSGKLLTTRFGS